MVTERTDSPTSTMRPHHPAVATAPGPGRREFLIAIGWGAGTLAVAGAAGLTGKAVVGGVFSSGTGAAYAAWTELNPSRGDPMGLVRAAVLAANAHNAQPWRFLVRPDQIDVYADTTRTLGTMDPLLRELHVSLGCAIENLVVAGTSNGLTCAVVLRPDADDDTHVARIDLTPTTEPASPLFTAVADRHTDRGAYDLDRPVSQQSLDDLSGVVDTVGTELRWLADPRQMDAFADLTVRATEQIIADPQQSADDFVWYREDWDEIQRRKDGITIDPSGKSPLIRTMAKLLPVSLQQSNDGWLSGTREQVSTAAAFGALVVRDPADVRVRLEAGRTWQRMHLAATVAGLSLQPLCQVLERIDRETSSGLRPDVTTAMSTLMPRDRHALMTFRIGYPTADTLPSPRRPAREVVST